MNSSNRLDNHVAAPGAARASRPIAAVAAFFTWWGEHRAWPANEPARIAGPACAARHDAGAR